MFRQITVNPEHRNFQRILWRDNAQHQIQEYNLNTVTYGTGQTIFLSVKVLLQLAKDEGHRFPLTAEAMKDFYVDDIMTGAHTRSQGLLELQKQLIALPKAIQTWFDSQITLSWIAEDPSEWETYIANRVARILEYTSREMW
ncbi:hypothetical protein DMENIID0001_168050 [Sergentomyia squamirostris]